MTIFTYTPAAFTVSADVGDVAVFFGAPEIENEREPFVCTYRGRTHAASSLREMRQLVRELDESAEVARLNPPDVEAFHPLPAMLIEDGQLRPVTVTGRRGGRWLIEHTDGSSDAASSSDVLRALTWAEQIRLVAAMERRMELDAAEPDAPTMAEARVRVTLGELTLAADEEGTLSSTVAGRTFTGQTPAELERMVRAHLALDRYPWAVPEWLGDGEGYQVQPSTSAFTDRVFGTREVAESYAGWRQEYHAAAVAEVELRRAWMFDATKESAQ